jgi:hypothetical protein
MGPDDARDRERGRPDIELDELMSREGPRDRSDDLYDGEW